MKRATSDFPPELARALDYVENRVIGTDDQSLIDRYDTMIVKYVKSRRFQLTDFADANFHEQRVTFYSRVLGLSTDELRWIVAHEFGHLTPENHAFAAKSWGEAVKSFSHLTPIEGHADAFARNLLGMHKNPGRFKDRKVGKRN